ncbi:HlyD family type I secretion periplasmic adaptor subunit (plasmid) [Azospirillum sp. 412522]|nr:HlyD family type I secretion periplasmic adaptor subunit [Azospirillum sp. 412522]
MLVSMSLVAGVGGWIFLTNMASAVVTSGRVVVESNVKKVQHPTGGVVAELNVAEGDLVAAGDVLITLDAVQTRAKLAVVRNRLDELIARRARLEAERDGAAAIAFPASLLGRMDDPDVGPLIASEQSQFELRRASLAGQKAQLTERIAQLREEIGGLVDQTAAKNREIALIQEELQGVISLWEKKLVPVTRVNALERDKARLEGEHGMLIANTAQTRRKIAETDLQIIQVDQDHRREVAKELADTTTAVAEMEERRFAGEDQLSRSAIRAPQTGRVHRLEVHTVGGVVSGGEVLMTLVPESDMLLVDAKVPPNNIDRLFVGQPVTMRFTAFNQRTTPEVSGEIAVISPDLLTDEATRAEYYLARIRVASAELDRLENHRLLPGMPVEVFIHTGERSTLSYLVKPLVDSLSKTFREE